MSLRGRSTYNPVSSSETEEWNADETNVSSQSTNQQSSRRRLPNLGGSGGQYSRLAAQEQEGQGQSPTHKEDLAPQQLQTAKVSPTTSLIDKEEDDDATDSEQSETSGEMITLVILDSAQNRFRIEANPDWTVKKFKKAGAKVHKVGSASQRLIFRGRMLDDTKTLKEMGIHQDEVIIHLFPKPRVVVTSSSTAENSSVATSQDDDGEGAHIPQIILDEEEQERRGQILVLGSYEIAEAQNNVRMLALILGTISFMRLLALFSLATGADVDASYGDDLTPPGGNSTDDSADSGTSFETESWTKGSTFDLIVSLICFYVARLGMKATYENTSRLALQYLVGTIVAGILWNIWNITEFATFVKNESGPHDDDSSPPLSPDDFRTIALFTVILPFAVWIVCCSRAWQFMQLIAEAEREASERIRTDLTLAEGDAEPDDDNEDEEQRRLDLEEIASSNDRPTIV